MPTTPTPLPPPVEAATADALHFCGHGGCTDSWLSSQRPQAEARPVLASMCDQLVTSGVLSASSSLPLLPHPIQWILALTWEGARDGLCTHCLDKDSEAQRVQKIQPGIDVRSQGKGRLGEHGLLLGWEEPDREDCTGHPRGPTFSAKA